MGAEHPTGRGGGERDTQALDECSWCHCALQPEEAIVTPIAFLLDGTEVQGPPPIKVLWYCPRCEGEE